MMKAPKPPNEKERMDALHRYEILDTADEREYDDITLMASQICGTPIALISLVDDNRQWFKSKIGMDERETARDIAFCAHGILQNEVFIVEDARVDSRFATNPLVTGKSNIQFYAGAPLITPDGQKIGMLCVNDNKPGKLSSDQKMALQALSRQVVTLLELRLNMKKLKESLVERDKATHQLMDVSRLAGMSEIATDVLHNVGNVLNSLNVSSSMIAEKLRSSPVGNIDKVVKLINEHRDNLVDFFTNNEKGKHLLEYLKKLESHLKKEQKDILSELETLMKSTEHIRQIIVAHQSYGKVTGVLETFNIIDLFQDALGMRQHAIQKTNIKVLQEFEDVPTITSEKHKVLQIFVNLINNASQAFDGVDQPDKQIILRVKSDGESIQASVIDNGVGICSENLNKIFNHGFTTKKDGHGFGLHGSALTAKELGGSLIATSDGVGKGTTFVLTLPIHKGDQTDENVSG